MIIKLHKGTRVHVGGGETTSVDDVSYETIKGILCVTNKRILFVSSQEGFDKKVSDLVAVTPYANCIELQFSKDIYKVFVPDGNIVFQVLNGYQKLHAMDYSYRDISFGNLFFDPATGEVLICDNDNVAASGIDNSSVYGTPRFMAPEIVRGKAKPSRETDLFSLAVLLFYMFMLGHPLEGKLEADIKCMDIHAMNKLYLEILLQKN